MLVDDDKKIRDILETTHTVAVVGASPKIGRDSGVIARFLQERGYTVFPVNPAYKEINGLRCYASLKNLPTAIDIVDVFRNPEALPSIVEEAIAIKTRVLWCQIGVVHEQAALRACAAGLDVVMDRCIAVEYRRLMG